ncbi:MAG: ABC transporter permease [Ornithinimicrobium sp.]|uniref:ABC transporter permease n=1 Tax=Ornithinimicrobium sp. TaxID=1977084 RepID=UPI0026E01844|nr:ABC transporter permease [Ornithinimicrobium sp.]MDO5739297.1 ABC transporter permease [Ornithinimicrobium sp.]
MKKDSLYLRYGYNDLVKNKGVNLALFVILLFSAFLMATGAMVMERSVGSVDELFDQAKPPHFLQMHKGDYDPDTLSGFASVHPEIESWLVEDMLGFDGAAIAWRRPATGESGDFSGSLIDNLFVTQNEDFDFLIDEGGAIPRPSAGEGYVPVGYQQEFGLQVGDELSIRTDSGSHGLTVAGFIRDSQMASSLSSATRFLVSEGDFQDLARAGGGDPEIIVEYRLSDPSVTSQFQTAYEADAALPKNGQAVTYQMIRLINAFSDGLVAIALVFVSGLLMVIALLNLRFVIRGTLEEEVRQIGVMKAIGLPNKAITALYLSKYKVMAVLGCAMGGVLAVIATRLLTRSIQVNYAQAPVGVMTFLVPFLALLVVYLMVIAMCRAVLLGVRRVEVVGALVHGSTLDEKQSARRATRLAQRARHTDLSSAGGGSLNRRLALLDLRAEGSQWILIPLVFALAAVLIILPTNLLTTFESPRFMTYMGAPHSDLRADLQFSDDLDSAHQQILTQMEADDRLAQVRDFANLLYQTPGEEGWEPLRVEVGDYSAGTVEFLEGKAPREGEIALSVLNADEHHLSVGAQMSIRRSSSDPAQAVLVSGIYQDVTSGGYTAKMQGEVSSDALGYVIYADTVKDADAAALAREYSANYPSASVIPMQAYVQQTLSYVTRAFRSAAILACVFGVGVALLITSLFLKLRLTRERTKMGVLSAIGFSSREIAFQVRFKVLLAVVAGTLVGIVLAATAGESLVGAVISRAGLGISSLDFIPTPWLVYLAYPLGLIAAGYLGAVALTSRLHAPDKSAWLKG